tara:strand:- start:2348 stop:2515 length:168 start_codon:yes stop_codon:yes gene_type:complete
MLPDYKDLALEIRKAQPTRNKHLIAEWCLDIYPSSSYAVRQHVRQLIIKGLENEN